MRKIFYAVSGAVLMALSFVACQPKDLSEFDMSETEVGDLQSGNFDVPAFASSAQRFEIVGDAEFQSIELTESGNFIVIRNEVDPVVKPLGVQGLRKSNVIYDDGDIICGSYSKNDDGSYELEGWGTIQISGLGDNVTITLTRNGKTRELRASALKENMRSELTDKVCRTWRFTGYRMILRWTDKQSGRTLGVDAEGADIKALYKSLKRKFKKFKESFEEEYGYEAANYYFGGFNFDIDDDEWDEEDLVCPTNIIFSKAGTYMVKYSNDEMGVSFWKWKDESKGTIYYSWDNHFEDLDEAGDAGLLFDKQNRMIIYESAEAVDDVDGDDSYDDYDDYYNEWDNGNQYYGVEGTISLELYSYLEEAKGGF